MIPINKPHLLISGHTHPGMTGKNNEDTFAYSSYVLKDSETTPVLLAIVADGIGGHQAGEVASQMAVTIVTNAVAESDATDPVGTLHTGLTAANDAIYRKGREDLNKAGMGTTVTCVWIIDDRLYAANVGNSRLYMLRGGTLRQISVDHSWVQEAMDHGVLTPEQAKNHPNASIITRYVGSEKMVADFRIRLDDLESDEAAVANQGLKLLPKDIFFLCSDGLSDLVDDPEIEAALVEHRLNKALEALTDLANQRGGHDNITTIVIEVPVEKIDTRPDRKRHPLARWGILLFSAAVLIALVLAGWWLIINAFFV